MAFPPPRASVIIPNSVTSIGEGAFGFCSSLTSVTIRNSVTNIGENAFTLCSSLNAINVVVYYLPGTMGWGPTYAGRPTALWVLPYPVILNLSPSFGVHTNVFGFRISWAANSRVVVEASRTLTNPTWVPVSTNTLTDGSSYFSDPDWTNYPSRLYRIRSP